MVTATRSSSSGASATVRSSCSGGRRYATARCSIPRVYAKNLRTKRVQANRVSHRSRARPEGRSAPSRRDITTRGWIGRTFRPLAWSSSSPAVANPAELLQLLDRWEDEEQLAGGRCAASARAGGYQRDVDDLARRRARPGRPAGRARGRTRCRSAILTTAGVIQRANGTRRSSLAISIPASSASSRRRRRATPPRPRPRRGRPNRRGTPTRRPRSARPGSAGRAGPRAPSSPPRRRITVAAGRGTVTSVRSVDLPGAERATVPSCSAASPSGYASAR